MPQHESRARRSAEAPKRRAASHEPPADRTAEEDQPTVRRRKTPEHDRSHKTAQPARPRSRETSGSKTRESGAQDDDRGGKEPSGPAGRSQSAPDEDEAASRTPRDAAPEVIDARHAVVVAGEHVRELTGRMPESVTSLEQTAEGWRIGVEVTESRRVPDTTDVLALYQVVLDQNGGLVSYRRERRYRRGQMEEEQP
jgi:hypothetical protein